MDVKRIPLWSGRNGSYISNDLIKLIIEDKGETSLELSTNTAFGGRVNAYSIPYFRGRELSVSEDNNQDWYKSKDKTYNAGGAYIDFPSKESLGKVVSLEEWIVKKYGSENQYGGLWKYSECDVSNLYTMKKIDLVLPDEHVVYNLIRVTNTGTEKLNHKFAYHVMLGSSFIEQGTMFSTAATKFYSPSPNVRKIVRHSIQPETEFSDLKHAPGVDGGSVNCSVYSGNTGTYDHLQGLIEKNPAFGYNCFINPKSQLLYLLFFPSLGSSLPDNFAKFAKTDTCFNYYGRHDSPWALYEGGTPQVLSVTTGFGYYNEPRTIEPGESKDFIYAQAFMPYKNPRIGLGYHNISFNEKDILLSRTKTTHSIKAETNFSTIIKLSEKYF